MIFNNWDKKEEFDKVTFPAELGKIDKLLKSRGELKNFVLGDKISFVDYVLFEDLEWALGSDPKHLDAFPALKAFHERFSKRPNLQV